MEEEGGKVHQTFDASFVFPDSSMQFFLFSSQKVFSCSSNSWAHFLTNFNIISLKNYFAKWIFGGKFKISLEFDPYLTKRALGHVKELLYLRFLKFSFLVLRRPFFSKKGSFLACSRKGSCLINGFSLLFCSSFTSSCIIFSTKLVYKQKQEGLRCLQSLLQEKHSQ